MNFDRRSGLTLQPRDFEVLLSLFECRLMSLSHATALFFDGKNESAKKRIQKLKQAGVIRERPRAIGEPSILHLTKKGFLALRETGQLDAFPALAPAIFEKRAQVSPLTLRHELEVMDVRVAFIEAIRKMRGLSLSEFSTWPTLFQFTASHVSSVFGRRELVVKPDAFIRIREETAEGVFEHMFFLEVDRSTETQDVLVQKAACYLDFYQSGGMAERFGKTPNDFRNFPFRVLMVFKNEERRNNTAERLLRNNPPIRTHVWLSTLAEVLGAPFGTVWLYPNDYQESIRDDRSPHAGRNGRAVYRRRTERERTVETFQKRRLLDSAAEAR